MEEILSVAGDASILRGGFRRIHASMIEPKSVRDVLIQRMLLR
jgi:hypothetical protein